MNFENYKPRRKFSFIHEENTVDDLVYNFPNIIKVDKPIIKIRIKETNTTSVLFVESILIPEYNLYEYFDQLKHIPTIFLYQISDNITTYIPKRLHSRLRKYNLIKEEFEIIKNEL